MIRTGSKELAQEDELLGNRKAGGGRKSALDGYEGIDELFPAILQEHTAGGQGSKRRSGFVGRTATGKDELRRRILYIEAESD